MVEFDELAYDLSRLKGGGPEGRRMRRTGLEESD